VNDPNPQNLFGDLAVRVRHEDLVSHPAEVFADLMQRIGLETDHRVQTWLASTVRSPEAAPYLDDPRWMSAFDRVGLRSTLEAFGYIDE
jgi:hypothetical protein